MPPRSTMIWHEKVARALGAKVELGPHVPHKVEFVPKGHRGLKITLRTQEPPLAEITMKTSDGTEKRLVNITPNRMLVHFDLATVLHHPRELRKMAELVTKVHGALKRHAK